MRSCFCEHRKAIQQLKFFELLYCHHKLLTKDLVFDRILMHLINILVFYNPKYKPMPNNMHLYPLLCIILILPFTYSLSYPIALQPDTTYQTGVQIIFTTTFSSTSSQFFFVPYTSIMTTPSVNATLGIYGINFYMVSQTFGWNMRVSSVSTTTLTIQLYVYSSSSYMSYLKLCYLVSSNPYIDVNFVQYNFNPAIDSIANNSLPDSTTCSFLTCRQYSQTQTYTNKYNPQIITFLAGFYVNSASNGDFGLDLKPDSPTLTSYNMAIRVYGSAQVQYVGFYYLSFDSAALNVQYEKAATFGTESMGCYYSGCGGGSLSNTGFTTDATQVLAYTSTMFFMGVQKIILKYSGNNVDRGTFDITAMSQNSDSKVGVTFSFSGNSNDRFTISYSYFTLQTFYCLASGPDLYFLYNQNKCDSGCSSISQFFDSSGVCTPCGSTCYRCAGTASYCTACYNSQNRVLDGNACLCDVVGGFYNDLTSLVCPSCHYSCLTCGGLTSSSCLTCNGLSYRYRLNNTCPCLTGYYDAGASLCVACHYTCRTATCGGTNSTSCWSCNVSAFRGPLSSSYACPCLAGYYDVTNVQQCSLCHYSCLTCSVINTNCSTCDGANHFRSWVSASKTCPCMTGYYDNLVSICVRCDSTCLTCSGPFSFNCLTCDGTSAVNRVIASTSCACANYFYQFNKTCVACHYSCYTCANNTATGCLSCISTSKRTYSASTGQCLCNFGTVDVGNLICQTCSNACLSCLNNVTACTSCHSNPGRYLAGTSCLCYSNYVDLTFNGVCTPCHYSCLTCFGGTSTTCSTCTTDRTLTTNACLCPVGKYDNGYSVTCDTCHVNCKTCTNGLISGCIGCQSLYFRTLNPSPLGTCVCQGGYYQVNVLACSPCNSKCLTCTGAATTCTSCDWTTNHRVITAAFTCDCDIGYYQTNAAACPACIASCRTCSAQSNNCTTCYTIRTLVNNTCFCNDGTFQTIAGVCMPCAASCRTCENSSTTCLTCPSNANRYQFGNTCPCNIGFFDNGVALCATCNYTCLSCTSLFACSACPLSSFRTLQMSSLCPCDDGYYDNGNAICVKCSPYCLTCQTFSQCLSCVVADNRQWNSLTLTCSCMAGFYDNGANSTCSACHYSCATCYAGTSNNCYTCTAFRTFTMPYTCPCSTAYFQSSNVCSHCSISCNTCSILSTNCTSCTSTSYLSSYQCICNNGYYSNGLICSACDVRCQTCAVTSTSCILCNPLHGTSINGSDCICASNQYQHPTSYICYSCNSYCLTCTSSTNFTCLSCHPTMNRVYNAVDKACYCAAGYYDSNALICSACNAPCATCTGSSLLNCTSCIAGYTLIGSSCMQQIVCANYYYSGVCLNTCPNTTYAGLNVCLDCINNCLTCSSTASCTSCKLNYYLHNSVCYAICLPGYYANPSNRYCTPCPIQCDQCALRNSTVICTSCNSTYYLKSQVCVSSCPSSTYVVIGQLCKPCLSQCSTCTSLDYNGCLNCSSGHYFYLGMCLLQCPAGFYSLNNQCLSCVSDCTSCTTLGCQTCSTGFYLTPTLKCVEIRYFLDSLNTKQKCHPNCLTCTDSSFSSCISCVQYRGDASSLAISGYCDCWKDSIDIGDGKCDITSFEPIKKANEALVSATSAINYLSLLSGVICVNFFAPVVSISYQQLYSNFYYLNSSTVLQTDEVLNQYGATCFNRMIEKQMNKKVGKYSNDFTRRLQATMQEEQSLFMRGYSWQYLIQWAFYTCICIVIAWIMCIVFSCLFQRIKKTIRKESALYKISQTIMVIFRENFMILVHFLTINDIGFYALASFKLLPQQQIQPLRLSFSVALFAYYIGYLIRLFIACIRYTGTQDQQRNFMVLFSCFYSQKKKITLSRLYIPMIMLRSLLISTALVFLAFYPVGQIVSSLIIFIIFTIYSFCYCPYYFYLSVFVHIFEVLFIIQLIILTVSIAQSQTSRISPAFGLIIFNFLQLLNLVILTVSIIVNKVYDIKCWSVKEKRILPFKRETNNQQVHIPVYKQRYVPKPQNITQEMVYRDQEEDTDQMDYQILQGLPRGKAKPASKRDDLNAILNRSQLFNSSLNSIPQKDVSQQLNPRRRRKAKPVQKQHIDIFSLENVDQEEIEKPRKANKRG